MRKHRLKNQPVAEHTLVNVYIRMFMQKEYYYTNMQDTAYYINWDSVFGIIGALAIFLFIYTFSMEKFSDKVRELFIKISKLTFDIYLIHVVIYFKLEVMGIRNNISSFFENYGKVGIVIYSFFNPSIVFLICMISIVLFQKIVMELLVKMLQKVHS